MMFLQSTEIYTTEKLEIDKNCMKVEEDRSDMKPIHSQLSVSHLSGGLDHSSTISTMSTTDDAETGGIAAKLSLFFADSRVARYCK